MTTPVESPETGRPDIFVDEQLTAIWTPRCIKLKDWPAIDVELLHKDLAVDDPLTRGGHGARLRMTSLQKVMKGYGVWLSFLTDFGWLDPAMHPADRITREHLAAYYKAMLKLGRRGFTVLGRFAELRMAMKILAPGHDTSFILRPHDVSIRQALNPHSRSLIVPDAAVLYEWGIEMMGNAAAAARSGNKNVVFRDGLLIAMFASRGRRLRSMALLRLGQEIAAHGCHFRVDLKPEQIKTRSHDAFVFPISLTPYIQKYITEIRPALLDKNAFEEFWIGLNGNPLSAKGIQEMIFRRSKARFGVTFGPHRFRHAIATTAALRASNRPGLAAPLLGISSGVAKAHYDRANQVEAVLKFDCILGSLRN